MKENEALGILSSDDIYNHIDTGRYSWEEIQEAVDILVRQQHTHTDAFIEKAVERMRHYLDNSAWVSNDVGVREKEIIIADFVNYLKGE